jgi:nitrosocyanin
MNKNSTVVLVVIIILILIGIVAYAFTSGTPREDSYTIDQNVPNSTLDDVTVITTSTTTVTTPLSVKAFTVTGKNFAFSPSPLAVKKGDMVKITFQNTGGVHDFVLDEFNVKTSQIQDGKSVTVEFVADKAGSFEYYCSVGNHRAMGMKGTLVVSE